MCGTGGGEAGQGEARQGEARRMALRATAPLNPIGMGS